MYTLKLSYGYLVDEDDDERETETVEILGTYEDEAEAIKAAENKFCEVMEDIDDPCEVRFGEVMRSPYRYYVTYGYYDCELGRVFAGYNNYYEVSVKEDY